MLGSSKMVNQDQVLDCLVRSWIVLAPNHRLCPQVNLLEGPMQDCRDLLAWVYDGGLEQAISEEDQLHQLDLDHVFAFGTSSGGTLALCLVSETRLASVKILLQHDLSHDLLLNSLGIWRPSSCGGHLRYVRPLQYVRCILDNRTSSCSRKIAHWSV
jgi:acetyl esterase/lipase